MKLNFKKLLLLFLPLFFLLPGSVHATEEDIDGATLYTYQSTVTDGVSFLRNTNGIIYPSGADKIDEIYIFFHGLNPPACNAPTECHFINPDTICKEFKICEKVALKQWLVNDGLKDIVAPKKNIAILIPQMDPKSGEVAGSFTQIKFLRYLGEALTELHSKIPNSPDAVSVAIGQGKGVGIMNEYLKYFPTETILIFDGCYKNWCEEMINVYPTTKKQIFYLNPETDPNGGTYGTNHSESLRYLTRNIPLSQIGAKILKTNLGQYEITEKCFLDHITNDNCNPKAEVPPPANTQLDTIISEINAKKPKLEINFPGLNFSNSIIKSDGTGTYVFIPWLAQFISALYKFGVGITSIIAVIIIILQGVKIIISGGGENKAEGYKKITHSLIGLLIAWGSFAILYNINPNLIEFNALKVKVAEKQDLPNFDEIQQTTDETIAPEDATEIINDTPKFTSCPITLESPLESKAKLPNQEARTLEFFSKIDPVITGQTQADRILQVADAAAKCGVRFGSCGRTDGTIYSLAGVVTEKYPKTCLYTNGGCKTQENTKTIFGWPTNINRMSREQTECEEICKNKGTECTDARTASTKKVMNTLILALTEEKLTEAINQLRPGDAFWIYNANGSVCRGNHAMIFDKWLSDGRAQVIQGMVQQFSTNDPKQRYSDGQVVYGAVCITQKCSDKFSRKPISRIFRPK